MPVALRRLSEVVQQFRRPSSPERPHLPGALLSRGRTLGTVTFLTGALAAFLWSNTVWSDAYRAIRDAAFVISAGGASLTLDVRGVVNEGLMTLFFFSVALAARRRVRDLDGGGRSVALVPCAAAAGALVAPVVLLALFTDIAPFRALALGGFDAGLALAGLAAVDESPAGARHPLYMFSTAMNAGWMACLALVGARDLSPAALAACLAVYGAVHLSRWLGARGAAWGLVSGAFIWAFWRRTGFPPAVAGALMAWAVPGRCAEDERKATELAESALDDFDRAMDDSDTERCSALAQRLGAIAVSAQAPIDRWQNGVLPWLSWLVLPLFGFVNGGVVLSEGWMGAAAVIAVAFLAGRPAGAYLFGWLAARRSKNEGGDPDSSTNLLPLSVLSCIGGIPAVMGAVIVVSDGAARGAIIVSLLVLSLAAAAAVGMVVRLSGATRS